ncbi:hypothetical protein [Winogradskyella aurantia]|nr:hypothetical protein [Winogradskyella aurantia]
MKNQTSKPASQTGRYFKYAIGEIILVVIGIMIALQINTWKEEQQLKKEERKILQNLAIDFKMRKNELFEFNEFTIKELNAIDQMLLQCNKPKLIYKAETLDSLLSFMGNSYSFNDSFQLLDLLFNTGKIDIIENEALKKDLLIWPWLVEEHLEETRTIQKIRIEKESTIWEQYISYADTFSYFNFRDYRYQIITNPNLKTDHFGLFNNRMFINNLISRRGTLLIMYNDRVKLIETADRILNNIEMDLK